MARQAAIQKNCGYFVGIIIAAKMAVTSTANVRYDFQRILATFPIFKRILP